MRGTYRKVQVSVAYDAETEQLSRGGIYSILEAAALIGATERQVRGWLAGYRKAGAAPLVLNELGKLDNHIALSFTNLIEMNFVAFFSRAGVPFATIRSIMVDARHELNHSHPFATRIVFRTDGKRILADIALKRGIKRLYDLRSRNYEMREVVFKSLKNDVVFDANGLARAWYPRRRIAPNVIVHPRFSFGQPVLAKSFVPTRALAEAARAEDSIEDAAALFDVAPRLVREAVAFEESLRKAA